jgi:hypothetical protein
VEQAAEAIQTAVKQVVEWVAMPADAAETPARFH